jgi:hypothetical protein
MKGICLFTKKHARPEPATDSDIEIINLVKRPTIVKPTQGPVSIDIPAKSRPLGSRSRGTDLSEVVVLMRGLVEVGKGILEELRGQQLAAEEQVIELRKHREAMTGSTEALCDVAAVLYEWLHPWKPESGSKKGKDKGEEEEGDPESVTELDTESESGKVVEKGVEEEEEESEQEPEKELVKEVEETMDTSQ